MPKLKSAKHHWWPKCVSRHWVATDGLVSRITPDGNVIRSQPEEFGAIRNGHHIKMTNDVDDWSVWDNSIESQFDRADHNFPDLISWLCKIEHNADGDAKLGRFGTPHVTDSQIETLVECAISLVVRGPRNREVCVSLAEEFRGPLKGNERNRLIVANMQISLKFITDSIGTSGKFSVLFSQEKEFIFGDGFFHNLCCVNSPPHSPRALVPLTPTISVIISRPSQYSTHPRFFTALLSPDEVRACNHAVQVYSAKELFFRYDAPSIDGAFQEGRHMEYAHPDNPIESLVRSLPGIPDRDRKLDELFGLN